MSKELGFSHDNLTLTNRKGKQRNGAATKKNRTLPQRGTGVKNEEDHRVKLLNYGTQKNQEKRERGKREKT